MKSRGTFHRSVGGFAGAMLVAGFVAAAAPSAYAVVLTKDQQKCVTTMQKDLAKTDKLVARQVLSCLKNHAAGRQLVPGKPGVLQVDQCTYEDPFGRLNLFETRTSADFTLRCTPPDYPSFGATTAAKVRQESRSLSPMLAHEVWGYDLDAGQLATSASNRDGAKCQQKVWKAVGKCEQTRLKEFEKCARTGTKSGVIDSSSDLRDMCLGVGAAGQPDPRGKIAKKCTDPAKGIQKMIEKSCGGQSLVALFPPCGTNSAFVAGRCMDRKVACRVCLAINRTTGTNRDCELLDDGLANLSCACGNGVINAGEGCDDGNNTSGDGCTNTCQIEIG